MRTRQAIGTPQPCRRHRRSRRKDHTYRALKATTAATPSDGLETVRTPERLLQDRHEVDQPDRREDPAEPAARDRTAGVVAAGTATPAESSGRATGTTVAVVPAALLVLPDMSDPSVSRRKSSAAPATNSASQATMLTTAAQSKASCVSGIRASSPTP